MNGAGARRAVMLTTVLLAACSGDAPDPPQVGGPVRPLRPESLDDEVTALVELYAANVTRAPAAAQTHGELGLVYEANGLWPEARRCFENASVLDSDAPVWSYHAAVAALREGDFQGGLGRLQDVVECFPGYAPAQHRLGDTLFEAGRFEAARTAFERAVELAPAAPEGFAGLGRVLLALEDPEGAARELRRALDLDPGFAMAHFLFGTALRRLGRADEAQREFVLGTGSKQRYLPDEVSGELLSLTSGVAPLLTNAQSRIEAGRVEEAIGMLENALAERPDNVSLLNQLSLAYKHNQELERALHTLMRARELEPDAIKTNVNLAETLIALGRWDTALSYADRCTVLAPSYGKGHFARGRALMFLQRFPEAYVALVSAIGFDRTNPHINIALGEACVRLGKFPEAAENFADAAQRLPDFLPVQVNSCMISLRLGNLSQAETALRAARRLAPDHPQVRQMASQVARARKL